MDPPSLYLEVREGADKEPQVLRSDRFLNLKKRVVYEFLVLLYV